MVKEMSDEIRRTYLVRGPCQSRGHEFPTWFDQHGGWLEYNVKADKVFYLCCYLFNGHVGDKEGVMHLWWKVFVGINWID